MSVTYLYTIKHIDSGKIYVGKSIHPEKRWREHLYHVSIGKQTQICRAIRKHGVERFVFEILDVAETAEMANLMEVGYIRTLQTHDPAFGYNGTFGGDGVVPTAETHQKNSAARKRYYANGGRHGMQGKHHTPENQEKARTAHLGHKGIWYHRPDISNDEIRTAYLNGESLRSLARRFHVDRGTVTYRLKFLGVIINSQRRQ